MPEPWDEWIPGVLNQDQVRELCDRDLIKLNFPFDEGFLDASSIDLHLTDDAHHMIRGSVKPARERTSATSSSSHTWPRNIPRKRAAHFSLRGRKHMYSSCGRD